MRKLWLDRDLCLSCGVCAFVCPEDRIIVALPPIVECDSEECDICVEKCPVGALSWLEDEECEKRG